MTTWYKDWPTISFKAHTHCTNYLTMTFTFRRKYWRFYLLIVPLACSSGFWTAHVENQTRKGRIRWTFDRTPWTEDRLVAKTLHAQVN